MVFMPLKSCVQQMRVTYTSVCVLAAHSPAPNPIKTREKEELLKQLLLLITK